MISKERLEVLIEKGATIYEVKYNNINPVSLKNKIRFISEKNSVIVFEPRKNEKYKHHKYFKNLFETLEEAEWHKEFSCIERTERLELPTWEELQRKTEHYINFNTKRWTRCWLAIDMPYKKSIGKILITYADSNNDYYIIYDGRLTKENYIFACRKCKELFLGESKVGE